MTKITEKIKAVEGKFVSFEFFPPKTDAGFKNLLARLNRMKELNPLFITVTWGAGGSTNEKSLELASICQKNLGITTVLHLTCTNTNKEIIDNALRLAKKFGIRNILALRGDPPRSEEYWTPNCDFQSSIDLIKYIRGEYDDYFCIGVAGYPEGHVDGSDTSNQNPKNDIPFLVEKIKAGGDFIITQLFYDVDKFLYYNDLLQQQPELKDVLLIPGLMPINTFNTFHKVSKLSHASIPDSIMAKMETFKSNDDDVKAYGIEVLNNIINVIHEKAPNVKGIHFYTINLERVVASIIESSPILSNQPVFESDNEDVEVESHQFTRRKSSVEGSERPIVSNSPKALIDISKGKGLLGKDANWDDFPNGRFGDSNSPAYGEIDGYGPSLKLDSPEKAIEFWGEPNSTLELAQVFINYLSDRIPQLPWVDTPLSIETTIIQEQLFELNLRGWFSTASQPATNACPSNDNVFGWGPSNGIVYQKAFIELFVPKKDWDNKIKPSLKYEFDNKIMTYFIGDKNGYIGSNLDENHSKTAVTWGVFPSKEVLQPTLIDLDSFKAWNEEAFLLWLEWARCYKKASKSYTFLNFIYDNYYLVSLIHHDFTQEEAMWESLLNVE
ncbi:methylenetetrahydrofolate reductase 1 [[Candida] jaroonii]|uniref:Methylenetetrahydrofolate reductase 1 n=1 Tax=[Candida] jaroonii TaxID=467808 RepID=A0ACA9YA33_9ASCO|nr:methylenetetrahydrofolate reductase 1 [[Candida] jaroonii]